jgi:hypothetical protein
VAAAGERQQHVEFFDQSTETHVVTDAFGKISEVNGAAVDALQRRKHHLRGKPLAVRVALERRRHFRQRVGGPDGGICLRLQTVE